MAKQITRRKSAPAPATAAPTKRRTARKGAHAASRAGRPAVPAGIQREREQVFATLLPIVDMLGGMLGDNVEIVLHDLTRPEGSIVAIANGHVSGRSVGHPILGGPRGDQGLDEVIRQINDPKPNGTGTSTIQDYPTLAASGQELRSASCLYRDSTGVLFAALCMNADLTVIRMAHSWLERQLGKAPRIESTDRNAPPMDALMRDVIADAVGKFGKPVKLMSKEEKITATRMMKSNGLFIVKGGVEKAAKALGVTRFTIYNYLEELRQRE